MVKNKLQSLTGPNWMDKFAVN